MPSYEPVSIDEAKRIKGQEYDIISKKTAEKNSNISTNTNDNHVATTSIGKAGVLDSVMQHHIEDIDIEKEKAITESKDILNEYLMYIDNQFTKAYDQYADNSKSQLEKRMMEDAAELKNLGFSLEKISQLIANEYYGLKNLGIDLNTDQLSKEEPKDTKTNFQKPIKTPLIDINSKKIIEISSVNREELSKEASKMCINLSNVIKSTNQKHQTSLKKIEQDISELEKKIGTVGNESYIDTNIFDRFFLEDMDLFNDLEYFNEFDAEGVSNKDDEEENFSMDDEDENIQQPPAEEPSTEENEQDDGEEDFSMDDDEGEEAEPETTEEPPVNDGDTPPEDAEDDGEENYEIPDDEEGAEGDEAPPADEEEENFSMDDNSQDGDENTEDQNQGNDNDNQNQTDTTSEENETNTKLKELESVIFDELTDDEKKMKITELKALYITVYKKCGTISDMLSEIKKDEETIQIIEYISNTLIDLKEYVNDYINKVFDSKTYVENLAQLQKYIMIFNAINKVFDQIKSECED